ncbi:MAG: alpha/beta hydrolase, partial [Pseudomonadota bacterium]
MTAAPFFADLAKGPDGGAAFWTTTDDGVRLRFGIWPAEGKAAKGTVFLFTGRTEYIEKYGPVAARFAASGLATLAIDWRGQGLSDRLVAQPTLGHVGSFDDFQRDVAAAVSLAETHN